MLPSLVLIWQNYGLTPSSLKKIPKYLPHQYSQWSHNSLLLPFHWKSYFPHPFLIYFVIFSSLCTLYYLDLNFESTSPDLPGEYVDRILILWIWILILEICFLSTAIFIFCTFLLIFCFPDIQREVASMRSKSSKTCKVKLHVEKIKYVKSVMDITVMLRRNWEFWKRKKYLLVYVQWSCCRHG